MVFHREQHDKQARHDAPKHRQRAEYVREDAPFVMANRRAEDDLNINRDGGSKGQPLHQPRIRNLGGTC